MNKVLTVVIPCYNSQDYMAKAIESVLCEPELVEVLVIDDGSTDETATIGKEYASRFPSTVRYFYKENGGHGDAVMFGLKEAKGLYFKVLDSDDFFDQDAFHKVLEVLKNHCEAETQLDMFIANYVYDKEGESRKVVIDYKACLPQGETFTWDEVGHFKVGHNLLMHSVIYRTRLLLDCKLELPKHTFYVDNIFVYYPLPFVQKMFYLDVDLYRYKIGREDQSVNEKVMIGRIDQQLYVNGLMIEMHDLFKIENENLREYMAQYLTMILTVSSALLVREGSQESLNKKEALWRKLRAQSDDMYDIVHKQILTKFVEKDGRARNKIIDIGYEIAQKLYHFS